MIRFFSKFISGVLHPLWMPFYLFTCLTAYPPSFIEHEIRGFALPLIILLLTGLLPAFNLILFRVLGTIQDLTLAERKDRIMPFLFITMIYTATAYLFYQQYPIQWAFKLLLLIASASMAGALITLWFKVSIHALAATATASILLFSEISDQEGTLFAPAVTAVIMSGMVMSARLWLEAHTMKEIIAGAITGIIVATLGMAMLF